nr:hypothetical protein [Bradyrhizobium sp. URHA0013]
MSQQQRSGKTVKEQLPCWDEKTQASFAERDCFDVYITSVTKVTGFGKSTTHNIAGTRGYEISGLLVCQSAFKFDPVSASNFDPFERRVLAVALAPSELVGVAETVRARVA